MLLAGKKMMSKPILTFNFQIAKGGYCNIANRIKTREFPVSIVAEIIIKRNRKKYKRCVNH